MARRITVDRTSRVQFSTQIARQLSWLIATGVLEADSYLPVISDLAGQLGVNVHTVRAAYRQLAEDGLITMQRGTRTRVLGYDRQRAWAGIDRHSSFAIGVLVPAFTDYYAAFLDSVADAAEMEGWLPMIARSGNYDAQVVSRSLDQLFSRNVDGIVAIHFETPGDTDTVEALERTATLRPFVLVDSHHISGTSLIGVDREADGFNATAHLIEHGHRRIGYVTPPASWSSTVRLGTGYSRAMEDAGIVTDGSLIAHTTDFSITAGAKATSELLRRDDPPTAIFCAGDILALGAIRAIREIGLRVPEDIAIMGYGEIPFAALANPPLSTTRMPADELGAEAVRILRLAIDTGSPQPPVTVTTSLVQRASCGCAPTL